jgi:protein-S-isoprenylcysteine O-methyltransferase Ste14
VIAWLGARQLAAEPPDDWKWLTPYRALILPVTTLAIVAMSYGVLLYVCDPFFSKTGKGIYNWIFIIGIVASTAWLIVTWVRKCAPQVAAVESRRLRKQAA